MASGKLDLEKDLKFGTLNDIEDKNVRNSGDRRRTSSLQALNASMRAEYDPNTLEDIDIFRGIVVHKRQIQTPRYQNRTSLLRSFVASAPDLPPEASASIENTTGNDRSPKAESYTAYKVYVPEMDPRPAPSSFTDPILHTYPDVLTPPGREDLKDLPLGAIVEIMYEDPDRLFNPSITEGTGETFIRMAGYQEEQNNTQLMFGNGPVQLMSDTGWGGQGEHSFDGQTNTRTGLLIGDSQSDGGGTLGGYLPKEFTAAGLKLEVEAKYGKGLHIGRDYWDIKNPEGRIQKALARVKPSFVIVELGGNDSYWVANGTNASKKATYKKTLETWVGTIKASGAQIVWFGPSNATKVGENGTPYDNLRQNVRNWQKEILGAMGTGKVQWFDTVPYTKELEMKTDGVHFVGTSYKAWAKALVAHGAPLAPVIASRTQATV
mgnify:CR=1 FL=1